MTRPFVSVLVPVRNEERYIERCLYALAAQDYPRDRFEVIVLDGQSSDSTPELVARFAAESTLDLRPVVNPRRLPASAMNIGLGLARGDVIVRVDGHAAVASDFLRRSIDALEATGADCVGGAIASEGDTFAGQAIALAMSSRFGVGGAAFRTGGEGPADTVAFGAYRRDVVERIGSFAEDLERGEDDEFNYRLRDAGGTILLIPEIRSSYTVRGDLPSLWRQYYGYGRAKPEVLRRHPAQVRLRQLAPPAFASALALAGIAAIFGKTGPLKRIVAVYTLAATIASLPLALRHGWRFLLPLTCAFACLHVSYGLGFLAGVVGLAGRIAARTPRPDAHQSTEAPA